MPARLLPLQESLPGQPPLRSPSSWDLGAELSGVSRPGRSPPHPSVHGAPLPSVPLEPVPEEHEEDTRAEPTEPSASELQDVFIAVQRTHTLQGSRRELLLPTWVSRTREHTFVFTDSLGERLQKRLAHYLVVTNCSEEHSHPALSC